jgi:hypothetical protein
MLRFGATVCVLIATAAAAQSDPRAEVRAALEDQAPVPSVPLKFPTLSPQPTEPQTRADQSARSHASEAAANRARAEALTHLPNAVRDAHDSRETAAQSAAGQARAEEAKKTSRGLKPPRPLPPGPPHP